VTDAQGNIGLELPGLTPGPAEPWATRSDLRTAAAIFVGLAVVGAVLGLVWQEISPRTKGFVYLPHAIIPQEKESLVASDGRFMLLTAAVAVVVAVGAWLHRASRGPAVAVALAAGGLLGAVLTEVIGRATGGGQAGGALNSTITLQVSVHARGLLLVEPALALLIYECFALFSKRDDLGRPFVAKHQAPKSPAPSGYPPPAGPSMPWPSPVAGPEQ
jgi:hypothetical protein